MKTVNVWGKEVKNCKDCDYCYEEYIQFNLSHYHCPFVTSEINEDIIHSDCPFLVPITKGVLEELGFEFVEEFINSGNLFMYTKEWFRKQTDNGNFTIEIFDNEKTGIEYEIEYDNNSIHREYWGKIMNVEELKFILKRLGI